MYLFHPLKALVILMRFNPRIRVDMKLLVWILAVALALGLAYGPGYGRALDSDAEALAALAGLAMFALLVSLVFQADGGYADSRPVLRMRREASPAHGEPSLSALRAKLRTLQARNAELERANRQAEARIEIKARFMALVSHEMRTPMNGIIGFAELLAQTPLADDQLDKLRLIERSAKTLLEIVNEILDLAKVEDEKFGLKPEFFPLRTYLEDAVALIGPRSKVPVVLCVEPSVPDLFYGDPIRLQQVLVNLLGNAIKFTHSGKIVVRVRRLGRSVSTLLFSVSDTGQGIATEHLGDLFSPFSQLGGYAVNGERGSGLGLNIARTIVERMGGTIGVVSKPGKGSTFWFAHPLVGETRNKPRLLGYKLALIDPDTLSRKALRFQLQSLGAAASGFASLEEFARDYRSDAHGSMVLLNARCAVKPAALLRGVERVGAAGGHPVLILPHSSRRIREYYRAKGVTCLEYPVRNETLAELLVTGPVSTGAPAARARIPEILAGRQFLVVDDNDINRRLLEARLTRRGARVVEAPNGIKALVRLRTRAFDLVFMDLRMPGMGGMDILRELLLGEFSPNHSTPFVAVTAHLDDEERIATAQAGFADVLLKPILDESLLRVLAKYLNINEPAEETPKPMPFADYVAVLLEKTGGNRPLAQSLARQLVGELREQSLEIQRALLMGDFAGLRDCVHRINGTAAFCGLTDIRDHADALERDLLRAVRGSDLERQAQRLDLEISRFLRERDGLFEALDSHESALALPD